MNGKTNADAQAMLFEKIENMAKLITVSLPAGGWVVENELYKQSVNIGGLSKNDVLVLFKDTPPDISEIKNNIYNDSFSKISGGQSSDDLMTFYATKPIDADINVCLAFGRKGNGRLLIGGGAQTVPAVPVEVGQKFPMWLLQLQIRRQLPKVAL